MQSDTRFKSRGQEVVRLYRFDQCLEIRSAQPQLTSSATSSLWSTVPIRSAVRTSTRNFSKYQLNRLRCKDANVYFMTVDMAVYPRYQARFRPAHVGATMHGSTRSHVPYLRRRQPADAVRPATRPR
ncbi:hypothetical protein L596_017152 [Steinernema carpocapsae]|uniref:Uncharacterized protein n=1 Tax=Steinernema carpocapsae TaxID=34508 RepID=A0A4U5N1K0_STECR|nr:hypothetical protein L596_017152 [Steinernema carpocapsae]